MILTNRFRFFNKKGYSLNPEPNASIVVTVVEPSGFAGYGAVINAYTNPSGEITYVEILSGGTAYEAGSYLKFEDGVTGKIWETPPANLTINPQGEIVSFTIPTSADNKNFSYPAVGYFVNQFLEPVSVGLISSDHIFIVENVFDANGKDAFTFPRVDEYGPYDITEYEANGTSASIKISTVPVIGSTLPGDASTVVSIPPAIIAALTPGMFVLGGGFPQGTTVKSIDATYNSITLTQNSLTPGPITFETYSPHNLRVGNTIRVFDTLGTTPVDGRYTISAVTPTKIFFNLPLTIPVTTTTTLKYGVIPVYRASVAGDEEFFLFDVSYNEEYPTITKRKEVFFELTDASAVAVPDTLPTGNTVYKRTVNERIDKEALQINIGLQADYEGVYATQLVIEDITFPTIKRLFQGLYEGETVAEDERFGKLLENFGRDVTVDEELILRDSDVYEDNPDYVLLNAKRKEMLLEGDNIWPYVGSYRGLVNMINWFGYYDVRIKEYWLNVNQEDEYFGKYRQMQVPFQLKDKAKDSEAISLLPSKHYKKTSLFGLFYDLVKDGGTFDVNGVPETVDAFEYTNEEILIKLFALKRYLKDKFLPLNARIVDITGEGVYYERYTVNSWNDPVNLLQVTLTRDIDFKVDKTRPQIIDVRPFDPDDTLVSPPYFDLVSNYTYKYNLNRALISNPGGPYFGVIPTLTFPGQAVQPARGIVRMKGAPLGIIAPLTPSGSGYLPGDIITLGGGSYENPIRITVNLVGPGGEVLNFGISAGPDQGSNYSSLPPSFFQVSVARPTGNQYVTASATGFTCLATDIPLIAESIYLYDKGLKYSTQPSAIFSPAIGGIAATLDLTTVGSTPVGYYNDGAVIEPYIDAPNIPVAAPIELSTSFDITWDELPYRWLDLGGGSDATLKAWVSPLPTGSGQLLAVEILGSGDAYRYAPSFTVSGGNGFGGAVAGEIKNGKLKILEYTATTSGSSIGVNDILTISPPLPAGGINAVNIGRIIKGLGIPDGTVTAIVNVPFSEIYVTSFDGSPVTLPVLTNEPMFIHQGAYVTANGAAYDSAPNIAPNGGHVGNLYTWDELGRGDMYQMEWRVRLTEPEQPGQIYSYFSGIKPIDELITHKVNLPYAGKYTAELVVYDTDNNFINEIKNNLIHAFLPDATFSYVARYISDCADTWDEFYQEPIPEFEPVPGALMPPVPTGLRYNWENANGRWVNPVFTLTKWEDARVNWDRMETGNLSPVNSYNFSSAPLIDILQVSAEDNLEGAVISYTDSNTTPSSLNPTITILGQRNRPEIEPTINPNDWIFIRRDDVIYQLEVLSSNYTVPNTTILELITTPPEAFRNNPTTWEVLREIGGTVVFDGNQIYDPVTNQTGIKIGEYIRLVGDDDIPKRRRVGIDAKDIYGTVPNSVILTGGGADPIYYEGGELGQIYKFRGQHPLNGNLNWNPNPALSTWVFEPSISNNPQVSDHIGKIFILDASPSPGCQPANPTSEIRPGFTILNLYVETGGGLVYSQRLRTVHAYFDTSSTGVPYTIWNGFPIGYAGIHVIDVVALDGGNLIDLNAFLASVTGPGTNIWMEYEYEVFPTRTYLGRNTNLPLVSPNAEIYMDFNMYPSSGTFTAAAPGDFPADPVTGLGWWYDHGIASGDYSLYVTNTGVWRNGLGTIVTVADTDSELLRSSSSFRGSQLNFDEDAAERKLGTLVQTWENSRALLWNETCYHTWDTVDYQSRYACNFRITDVDQNGSIQMNNDQPFFFQGIVGGMSNAQKFSVALYELRENDNTALSRFDYQVGSLTAPNPDVIYISGQLDTYNFPNDIINYSTSGPIPVPDPTGVLADIIIGEYISPNSYVTLITPPGPGSAITLSNPLPKKLDFVGSVTAGSYFIRNITGLLDSEIYVGEIITGPGLPSAPAAPAQVLEIISSGGQVRQLKLSQAAISTEVTEAYFVEWFTPGTNVVSFQHMLNAGSFYIDAYAKTPSVDHLGWLLGQNGVLFYDWSLPLNVPICHTYPVRSVINRFGFGPGLVGAFQGGLNEFLINERSLQVFFYEGLNPVTGTIGWYPSANLNPIYGFITNDPLPTPPSVDNELEAEAQSNRLPYETAIGGAWRWEETYIGILPTSLPSGSTVLLTSDASQIAGKTQFSWKLKEADDNVLVEILDPSFMWTFNQEGKYTIDLEITDTNGNKKLYTKKDFFEIYETN
jgi:hypothetical protein